MQDPTSPLAAPHALRLVSWNLFHEDGATLEDIRLLIRVTRPDILLMQECRLFTTRLPDLMGGHFSRLASERRVHGTACWSRHPFLTPPRLHMLPPGLAAWRSAQLLEFDTGFGPFTIANVHLSHGPILNRRQLRLIRQELSERAIIIGDFNQVGPAMLRGFEDVGPREQTHRMLDKVPLRLDRCLVRGFSLLDKRVYPRFGSDHRPIAVTLQPAPVTEPSGLISKIRKQKTAGRIP
ncbi:endonuclease/exonuclease/phosphatase family protein [Bombella sp. TMW 2.2559]|uniref:Endonuclease/exonuclease/phosphatase family protein n=1 Tax=Bombella dulcis TaxID=2967339 RepID=A0ABT3W961_9PROT|nr:endonuclease/exonuclease/phosphatase family protein [Bombella dulcis]MCX5615622.1 endonuclease/exonuclease/phosphatase family protein [Bombella dulcis]